MNKEELKQKVTSYEAACALNGSEPMNEAKLLELGVTEKQIAGIKLEAITLALNNGVPTDIYNGEKRWYPYFWSYDGPSGFAFDDSSFSYAFAFAGSGSRLSYHDKAMSDYSGTQFIELWKEYLS